MANEQQILVAGRARAETPPDYAALSFSVTALKGRRDEALDDVARRSKILDSLLDGLGEVLSNRVTTSVRVEPHYRGPWDKRVHDGYEASRTVTCEVRDPSVLGGLLREAAAEADASVQGPWWRVDDANAVYDEARRLAAGDARRRAQAYAAGLGFEVGEVAWVAEPGLRETRGGSGGPAFESVVAAAPQAAPETGEEGEGPLLVDVVADRVVVTARVEVGFLLRA